MLLVFLFFQDCHKSCAPDEKNVPTGRVFAFSFSKFLLKDQFITLQFILGRLGLVQNPSTSASSQQWGIQEKRNCFLVLKSCNAKMEATVLTSHSSHNLKILFIFFPCVCVLILFKNDEVTWNGFLNCPQSSLLYEDRLTRDEVVL